MDYKASNIKTMGIIKVRLWPEFTRGYQARTVCLHGQAWTVEAGSAASAEERLLRA